MFKAIEPIYGHSIGTTKSDFPSCCVPSCEKEALAVAAAMEKGTTHPIGRWYSLVVTCSSDQWLNWFTLFNQTYLET